MLDVKRPIDETYEDVEKLIYHTVWGFISSHGGDFDELCSIANQVFMDVYNGGWQPDKGTTFTGFLALCITRRLQDNYWNEKRHQMASLDYSNECSYDDGTFGSVSSAGEVEDYRCSTKFNFSDFTEEMSEDAKTVVKLVLETPAELTEVAMGKGGDPRNWRSTIRDFLCSIGWSYERVSKSFNEVRGTLGVA